jgi:hypothetical protein
MVQGLKMHNAALVRQSLLQQVEAQNNLKDEAAAQH